MTKVLITVKTYPHPSKSHKEFVCTAGITETYDWVRLYPIDFRYLPHYQQYKKYQWVDLELSPNPRDKRKESRRPKVDTIKLIGKPIGPENNWQKRRDMVDHVPVFTLNELKELNKIDGTSLGIVKPTEVLDIKVTKDNSEWKPEHQAMFNQLNLFEPPQKPLKKIPYKFQYIFKCHDNQVHRAMITDWELGVLYLNEVIRKGSEVAAAESVKYKFLDQICNPKNDVSFFMGTTYPYNSWIVLGVFYPKK